MGSKIGVLKIAAKRLGMTFEQYMARVENEEKHCGKCQEWKDLCFFHVDNSRGDGRASVCKKCRHSGYHPFRGKALSESHRNKIRKGVKMFYKKNESPLKGRIGHRNGIPHTPETRKKISEMTKLRTPRGKSHYSYTHGMAERRRDARRTAEYANWRRDVFSRDGYTCRHCGDNRGGNLHAHHIKPFASCEELRFDVSNGVTLCKSCHEKEHYKADSIRNKRKPMA